MVVIPVKPADCANGHYYTQCGTTSIKHVIEGAGLWSITNSAPDNDLHITHPDRGLIAILPSFSRGEFQSDGRLELEYAEDSRQKCLMIGLVKDQSFFPEPVLAGKKFCIDAGHGGKDPGAVNAELDLQEKHVALNIATSVAEKLILNGANVILTRDNDTYIGLTARAKMANDANCDAFISVHLNAADNPAATGYEVLVYDDKKGFAAEMGKDILGQLKHAVPFRDRGLKPRPDLTVLSNTKMPAVLVEAGFISNNDDARLMAQTGTQEKLATAIAKGVVEAYTA